MDSGHMVIFIALHYCVKTKQVNKAKEINRNMDSLFQEYSNENTTELSLQDDGAGPLTERAVAKA